MCNCFTAAEKTIQRLIGESIALKRDMSADYDDDMRIFYEGRIAGLTDALKVIQKYRTDKKENNE